MDTKKLPLSMLVALGLAPGCDDIGCTTKPCLNIAEPPTKDDGKGDTKDPPTQPCLMIAEDPKVNACLSPPPDDSSATPCLSPEEPKTTPCLSPPRDPSAGPCLDVQACLSKPRDPSPGKCLSDTPDPAPAPNGKGGMARLDVIDRLLARDVLPSDVASRLRRGRDDDA